MAGINHSFTSTKSDGPDASIVKKTQWNADHVITGDVDLAGFGIFDTTADGTTKLTLSASGFTPGGFDTFEDVAYLDLGTQGLSALLLKVTRDDDLGPNIIGFLDTASAANNDQMLTLWAYARDSAGNIQNYGKMGFEIEDPTSTTESGFFRLAVMSGGALSQVFFDGLPGGVTEPAIYPTASAGLDLGLSSKLIRKLNVQQVYFNGDTAAANALDDYEEGTFTPTLTFGGGSTGMTFSVRAGAYTKVGNLVTFGIRMVLTAKGSSTGTASIGALPFTSANINNVRYAMPVYLDAWSTTGDYIAGELDVSATSFLPRQIAAGVNSGLSDTNFTNTSTIIVTGHYYA